MTRVRGMDPTPLGLWALTPAPMARARVVDPVARAKVSERDVQAAGVRAMLDARWAQLQAKERARIDRMAATRPAPVPKRRGRSGEPSAISPAAPAALARTAAARAAER